jgi:hypothetical protein
VWRYEIAHCNPRMCRGLRAMRKTLEGKASRQRYRFPLIVETLARLRSRYCVIDGRRLPVMTTASLHLTRAFSYTPST